MQAAQGGCNAPGRFLARERPIATHLLAAMHAVRSHVPFEKTELGGFHGHRKLRATALELARTLGNATFERRRRLSKRFFDLFERRHVGDDIGETRPPLGAFSEKSDGDRMVAIRFFVPVVEANGFTGRFGTLVMVSPRLDDRSWHAELARASSPR